MNPDDATEATILRNYLGEAEECRTCPYFRKNAILIRTDLHTVCFAPKGTVYLIEKDHCEFGRKVRNLEMEQKQFLLTKKKSLGK